RVGDAVAEDVGERVADGVAVADAVGVGLRLGDAVIDGVGDRVVDGVAVAEAGGPSGAVALAVGRAARCPMPGQPPKRAARQSTLWAGGSRGLNTTPTGWHAPACICGCRSCVAAPIVDIFGMNAQSDPHAVATGNRSIMPTTYSRISTASSALTVPSPVTS